MYPRWTETTKRMMVVIGVALGLLLLYLGRFTLTSLLLAAVVAYVLYPIVEWFRRRLHFPHMLATITVYVLLLAVLATIPILVVPMIVGQVQRLDVNLTTLLDDGREWLRATLTSLRILQVGGGTLDLSSLVDPALNALGERGAMPVIPPPETWLPNLFGTLSGVASTITSATLAFFLTLLYSFYLVSDADRWRDRLETLIPDAYRPEMDALRHHMSKIWGSFFRGQLLLCLIVAAITFAALAIMGIPGSIPLALVVGVLEVIPNIGPLIALMPIVVVALIQGSSTIPLSNGWIVLIVSAAYILIQLLANNVLAPIIIGGSVELPPLVMLVGVVIGASTAGLIGAFLATPILATLRVLALYAYNKVLDRPPFPELAPKEPAPQVLPPETEERPAGDV
jgi:predicted PurR-regulated permease PerM